MSTTPTRTSDRVRTPDRPKRPALTVGTIAAIAVLIVAAAWFLGTRGGDSAAFPVLGDSDFAEAQALVELIQAYETTWDTGDLQGFTDLLADDGFTFTEPGTLITSKEGFVAYMDQYFESPSLLGSLERRYFVGDGEVVEAYLTWGWAGIPETNPVVEVERFTVENDRITSIHSMYDPTLRFFGFRVDPTDLLTAYASAWSSGDPDALPPLYAPDVVRAEGLYGVELRGVDAITRHAGAFFARHPGATWTIVEPYVFTSGPLSGAVFNFAEPRGCDLQMTVLVEMDDAGLIASERIYHDVPAIRACGWQR
jgi:ketosteroid isomerase-like protein